MLESVLEHMLAHHSGQPWVHGSAKREAVCREAAADTEGRLKPESAGTSQVPLLHLEIKTVTITNLQSLKVYTLLICM